MTVRNIVPIAEYTADGVITRFDWDWDMIEDSTINVLVDNTNVTNWELQDQSVVFDTAPDDGADIKIYRRTLIWQPENYRAFGRFHSEKTELSVDRATLIAQERAGDRLNTNAPNGIVGGSDLSITRGEFDVTVVSERGTDAVVPMYDPDGVAPTPPGPPDPTIIWASEDVLFVGSYSLPGNTEGITTILRFKMDFQGGDPTEASAYGQNYNAFQYIGWLDADPNDDEYWMRVRVPGPVSAYPENLIISDGSAERVEDVPFQMRQTPVVPLGTIIDDTGNIIVDDTGGYILPSDSTFEENGDGPYIALHTFGDTPPTSRTAQVIVDICKDDGTGLPDGNWATRSIILEALFNG